MFFHRVAVVGVGLIGGSFALALKAAKCCGHVTGAGRGAANLELALERGVIDSIAPDAAAAVQDADLVLISTPVAQIGKVFLSVNSKIKPGAIVTDAGSTKGDVVADARAALGGKIGQFIPAHPIAGAEHSGAAAATAELFKGRRLILTPLEENNKRDIESLSQLWAGIGARVSRMTPEAHDAAFAAVSHLPHLLAFALVHEISGRPDAAQLFGYAAGGFRDFTRIASSHPEMWRDICVANRDHLLHELRSYEKELKTIGAMLETGDASALEKLFSDARAARGRWLGGEYE